MPDTTPVLDPKVQAVAQDALDAATIGQAILAAVKKGGATAALSQLPAVIAAAQKDYSDVTAAMPVIKTGYKTTEFWLALSVFLVNGGYFLVAHKVLPLDLNLVLGAVAAVYAFARSMVKSGTVTAAATVAATNK